MMVNDVQSGLPPIGFWTQDSLPAADNRSKVIPGKITDDEVKLRDWQFIFLQSRANGCFYDVEDLPRVNWQWPKNTWFQDRLNHYPCSGTLLRTSRLLKNSLGVVRGDSEPVLSLTKERTERI